MDSFEIWDSQFVKDVSLELEAGALIFVVREPNRRGQTILARVDGPGAASEAVRQLLDKVAAVGWMKAGASPEIKLVGQMAVVTALRLCFERHGIGVSKEILKKSAFHAIYYGSEGRLRVSKGEPEIRGSSPFVSSSVKKKIKVLVVDDSATMRQLLTKILEGHEEIEVVASLGDPREVEDFVRRRRPDVVTVDLHMPVMSGVDLIKQIAAKYRLPMLVVSSLGLQEGSMVMDALEAGAVDYLQKPDSDGFNQFKDVIYEKVIAAAGAVVGHKVLVRRQPYRGNELGIKTSGIIAIGASTGGTEAIKVVLSHLPAEVPPIVVTQHIPPVFSQAFAQRLNQLFDYNIAEASDGDVLRPNCVYVAPGGQQMRVKKRGQEVVIVIGPAESGYRHNPSVDVLFESVAEIFSEQALAVILTGMGKDGTEGLLKLKAVGAFSIGQDEASSVVYGMPRAAFEAGAVDVQSSLDQIGDQIISRLKTKRSA